MCEIINATKMGDKTVIDCSPYNGDFMNATILEIIDANKKVFRTRRFTVEKTRACFSEGGSPWVMVNDNIPDSFLNKGNEILFQ